MIMACRRMTAYTVTSLCLSARWLRCVDRELAVPAYLCRCGCLDELRPGIELLSVALDSNLTALLGRGLIDGHDVLLLCLGAGGFWPLF